MSVFLDHGFISWECEEPDCGESISGNTSDIPDEAIDRIEEHIQERGGLPAEWMIADAAKLGFEFTGGAGA